MKRILHIVPDSFFKPEHLFLGSTKDIHGRTEYFQARDIGVDTIVAENRSDEELIKKIRNTDLDQYFAVFFEYPLYPSSIQYIKSQKPEIIVLTRSINAEFYHSCHQFLASTTNLKSLVRIRGTKGPKFIGNSFHGFKRLHLDYTCARLSDYLLSISSWETDHYWKHLVPESKVRTLPYFLPGRYLPGPASNQPPGKKFQCVAMMSTTGGTLPFTLDATRNFNRIVGKLGNKCPEWHFFITGKMPVNVLGLNSRIQYTGFLQSPFDLLSESRAMALFSDYGFGFKTKLLDAICNNCYPMITKKLYNRLPTELKPYCIVVDISSVKSFEDGLEQSLNPFPDGNPNELLRKHVFSTLDSLLST